MVESYQAGAEIEYDSKQPLEELVFVESGTHNLREIKPMITLKGIIQTFNTYRAH